MADTKSDESSKSNLPMTHRVLAGDGYVLANQAQDSSHLLSDPIALNKALDTDGVLYLSGFLDRLTILSARQYILKLFESEGFLLPGSDRMSAIRNPETVQNAGPSLLRRQDIACAPPVMDVLEHSRLSELSRLLLNAESVRTTKYKWLRAVQRGLFTGLHIDRSYFQKENNKILTIWIPFGDIPIEQGTLLWCPGSHRDARYADVRLKYGSVDLGGDGTHSGWQSTWCEGLARGSTDMLRSEH
eukprot:1080335_1